MQLSDLDKVTLLVMGRARTPDLTLVLFPLHDAVSDPFLGAVQTHNLDNSLDQMDRAKPKNYSPHSSAHDSYAPFQKQPHSGIH